MGEPFRRFDTEDDLNTFIDQKVAEAKGKLPLPSKKPERFKTGRNFRRYLVGWDNYAEVAKIPENRRLSVLKTFLDAEAQESLDSLNLEAEADWRTTKPLLIGVIDKYRSKQSIKETFLKTVHQSGEKITEFGNSNRLKALFREAYDGHGDEDLICTVFRSGLSNDAVAIQLHVVDPTADQTGHKFLALLRKAQELESAIKTRTTAQTSCLTGSGSTAILSVSDRHNSQPQADRNYGYEQQYPFAPAPGPRNYNDRYRDYKCHRCGMFGHIRRQCPQAPDRL